MTELGSSGGGKAAKRPSSWFTSSSLNSSSFTSSNSVSEISSSVKTGDFVIGEDLARIKPNVVVILHKILHYREPVNDNSRLCHHFGLLEVRMPSSLTTELILFEKGKGKDVEQPSTEGTEKSKPGGKVTVKLFHGETMWKRMEKKPEEVREVKLEGCPKIRMQDLLDLLTTEHTPSYTLWTNNCWKYVYDCQKKMLCRFAEDTGTSPACKESMVNHLQNLEPPALISDVFNWKMIAPVLGVSICSGSSLGPTAVVTVESIKSAFCLLKSLWMTVEGLGKPLILIPPEILMTKIKLALTTAAISPGFGFLNMGLLGFFVLSLKAAAIVFAASVLLIIVLWLVDVVVKNCWRSDAPSPS